MAKGSRAEALVMAYGTGGHRELSSGVESVGSHMAASAAKEHVWLKPLFPVLAMNRT